jgi:mannitol-specific phosphotransferase system IIBC component
MEPLTKKESTLAAVVGVVIGTICGMMISLSMLKEHKKCEVLKKENQLLQEMVMQYQEREYVAN